MEEQRTIVIWDDELFVQAESIGKGYSNIVIKILSCADRWFEDISLHDPVCVLLDNDMGAEHLRGWMVCCEIRCQHPRLPVFCISDNPAPIVRMSMEGAVVLSKHIVPRFLKYLDERWHEIYDTGSRALVLDKRFAEGDFI